MPKPFLKRATIAYHKSLTLFLGSRWYAIGVLFKTLRHEEHKFGEPRKLAGGCKHHPRARSFFPLPGSPNSSEHPSPTYQETGNHIPQFLHSQNAVPIQLVCKISNISLFFFFSPSIPVFDQILIIPQLHLIRTPKMIEVNSICVVLAVAVVVAVSNACYRPINALKPQNGDSGALDRMTARAPGTHDVTWGLSDRIIVSSGKKFNVAGVKKPGPVALKLLQIDQVRTKVPEGDFCLSR
ncbi:hypothetical protein HOY82DRAFT_667587 [Tuber indicum]|nr:hypothetical protein HOY82DRAFT_667587 [Tuber indicum]